MNAHTPLPWFAVNDGTANEPMWSVKAARIAGQKPRHEVAICATGDSPQEMETANAAFIVKCVNAHDDLVAALKTAQRFVASVRDLISDSHGVAGLHLNGDLAPWDELLPGGRFEDWLGSIEPAETSINAALSNNAALSKLGD
jgi:hypothetical protein